MRRRVWLGVFLSITMLPFFGCGDEAAEDQGVIAAAMRKTDEAGSYQSDFDMQLHLDVSGPEIDEVAADIMPLELSMRMSMESQDVGDYEKAKVRMYDVSVDGTKDLLMMIMEQEGEPPAAGHILDGMMKQMIKDVEVLTFENDMYFYFGDQWYEFSPEDIASMPDSGMDPEEAECLANISSEVVDYSEIYDRIDDVIVDVRDEGGEEVDGVETTLYTAAIDAGETTRMIEEYIDTYTAELEKCGTAGLDDEEGFQEFIGALGGMMESVSEMTTVEVWIDAEGYIRQQRLTLELDRDSLRELLVKVEQEAGEEMVEDFEQDITYLDARLVLTSKNSRIGEDDIELERPKDAVPFLQLFEELEETLGGGSTTESWNG